MDDEVAIFCNGRGDDVGEALAIKNQIVIGARAEKPLVEFDRNLERNTAMPPCEGAEDIVWDTGKETIGCHIAPE
jgi:hypothetical protein